MREINLLNHIHALETLDEQHMEIYARTDADDAGKVTKPQEEEDLACFVRLLAEQIPAMDQYRAMDRFYLGYIIPQIGKEFDLLKFGKDLCVNIEIKNNGKPETILRQLLRNRYYLRALDCPCVLYSFAAADRKLYMLKEDTLQDGSWEELAEHICRIREYPESSPDLLFKPGRFLISPIYTPLRFLNGEYFLTTHQEAICNDILRGSGKHCCIEGKAGTGKTLLLYHLYRKLCAAGRNGRNGVCMVQCGDLLYGHGILLRNGLRIVPLAEADRVIGSGHMHTVLFDEVQYTDPDRIGRLLDLLDEKGVRGIFAFDPVWASYDSCSTAAVGLLKQREDIEQYRLTAKIRTNRETAVFTECLFDLTRRKVPPHPHNIRLAYTEDRQETETLIRLCREEGYRNISREETLMRGYLEEETDRAVVVLDASYSYGEGGRLVSADPEALRRLQRRVSRVRQSLYVVTENNPAVFRALVSLFR